MAVDVFAPGEVCILFLWSVCKEEVAEGVGFVTVEDVFYPDGIVLTLTKTNLFSFSFAHRNSKDREKQVLILLQG